MADHYGNPFVPEETKRSPAPKEHDPPTAKQAGKNDPIASVEQMEPEPGTEPSTIEWAHDFIISIGQVEPGTTTLTTSSCQGIITPPHNHPGHNTDPGTEH